jgi:hypothetical protein
MADVKWLRRFSLGWQLSKSQRPCCTACLRYTEVKNAPSFFSRTRGQHGPHSLTPLCIHILFTTKASYCKPPGYYKEHYLLPQGPD